MNAPTDTDDRTSREIEGDIRKRRQQMDSTLDELGERLTLRSLVHSALDWWDGPSTGNGSAAARRACSTVGRQIKHHPMPSLLIGGGIAWLLSEAAGDDDGDGVYRTAGHAIGSGLSHAKDAAVEAMGDAKDRVVGAAEKIHEKADHLAHETVERGRESVRNASQHLSDGYHAGAERFSRAADDYPLAVGAAFAALGVLVGLALPRTRKEDELMGEQSDHLIEVAKEEGEHVLEAGKAIGERVVEAVKDEAASQGLTGGIVKSGLESLGQKASAVVERVKEAAVQASHDEGLEIAGAESREQRK